MAAKDHLEALTAEMLGDILKLHDAVESLKTTLPAQTEAVEAKLSGLIDSLHKAGDIYKGQITEFANSAGRSVQVALENDYATKRADFDLQYRELIQATLADARLTINAALQPEIERLNAGQPSFTTTLAAFLVGSLFCGVFVISGNYLLYGQNQEAFTDLGKAVTASWSKLDSKAKATINAEREPKTNGQ